MKGALRSIAQQLGPQYFVRKTSIFKQPSDGILTGWCFDRARKQQHFYIWAFCLPLYVPEEVLSLLFGQRLGGGSASWYLNPSGANVPDILSLLNSKESREITSINTPTAFVQKFERDALATKSNTHTQEAVAYSYAKMQKWAQCVQLLTVIVSRLSHVEGARDWRVAQLARAKAVLHAAELDSNAVDDLLREWEIVTRRNLLLPEL
jgi:hypothetical protein